LEHIALGGIKEFMYKLSIDLETRSDVELTKSGVYPYVESPFFDILLFAVSVDDGPVTVYDLASGESIPPDILAAFSDESVIKNAFNVNFERICISAYLRKYYPEHFHNCRSDTASACYLPPVSWHCDMIHARYLGMPSSLSDVGKLLKLEQQKMTEGRSLIKYFCTPYEPGKFHSPADSPDKWNIFKEYNKRDVEAELEIQKKLSVFPVPDNIWYEFYTDQDINDRGILVDRKFAENAVALDTRVKSELVKAMQNITALENPNSVAQMKKWLSENGIETETLGKKDVAELVKTAPPELREALILRQQLAKSSVKKYTAMENAMCADGRIRGMFSFYGANRTGRFSGRYVQLQNCPQNHMSDLEEAKELIKSGNFEAAELLYDDIPDVLSQLIRTALIPREGTKFIVADFSAIEARVIAWLAGEQWRMDAFRNGEDIYCASASKMFGVPVVKHGENGHLRQKGKVAELACIAEGQLVLTDNGLIPIEKVTTNDKLWDGESWVSHDGVVYKGEREVITYEGLTATTDHLVWVEGKQRPIQFGLAASCSAHLIQTGDGRRTIRLGKDNQSGKAMDGEKKMLASDISTSRLYDIRNAGPHHRFTVSGKLVHNCGYGGSVGAMTAMGGSDLNLSDAELKQIVDDWRAASPNIVRLWWDTDRAAKKAVKEKCVTETHGLTFSCESGFLFITLPSGRRLAYVKPKIGENKFGGEAITYEGTGTAKKWERLETYGPKLVENIVQGIARDLLVHSMQTLSEYKITGHVHDELIIECEKNKSVSGICDGMALTPEWAEGLMLRADGYECKKFYMKD